MLVNLATNGSYSGLEFEYYNGSWTHLNIITAYSFTQSRYCDWVIPDDWDRIAASTSQNGGFPSSGNGSAPASVPDSNNGFWIRIRLSDGGSQTTAAVISKLRVFPYAAYTTPERVASFLQLPVEQRFDYNTVPNIFELEELIRVAESTIDQYVHKSWRFNYTQDFLDFNTFGIPVIHHHDLQTVYEAAIWNGTAFDILTEGRTNDYFIDYQTGTMIFTRYYLLPMRAAIMRGFWRWDVGEFQRNCRLTYSYGFDPEVDQNNFKIVQGIANRLVAIDLIENHNFGVYLVQGNDKVGYSEKVRLWQEEAERAMDRIASFVVF